MIIEWDEDKAASNLKKHGIDFDEASTALLDPMALAREDLDAEGEGRWVLVGMSLKPRVLTVVYTVRSEATIRIISDRKATKKKARFYA